MKIFDTVAREIRKEALASGRGRLVEGSLRIEHHGVMNGLEIYGARFAISRCNGNRTWYDTFFNENGARIGDLFA